VTIRIAETVEEIRRCYPVMVQLRPHLSEAQFVAQVQRQRAEDGYVLVWLEEKSENPNSKSQAESAPNAGSTQSIPTAEGDPSSDPNPPLPPRERGGIKAVAGFRMGEFLAWGKTLYVDDLIADEATRGQGYASKLYDWLVEYARREGCDQFHLDSGTGPNRYRAHRFYLGKGMDITSHHFAKRLKD
jgi:ribosomal protein S18 acetylase RimI-like enzyme